MAGTQHTQTHPKFIYTFLALHHDRMADGATTVHVAADTLVDARKMVKEGANKRGNTSRLTQSFHFFMFEPIFSPVNALNQPI